MAEVKMAPNSEAYKTREAVDELNRSIDSERKAAESAIKPRKKIKGEVSLKKKPLSERFMNAFLAEDLEHVFDYVWDDVVIPKLKDFVFELVDQTTNGILYGTGSAKNSNGRYSQNNRTNYNSISSGGSRYSYGGSAAPVNDGARRLSYQNIYLKSRDDANDILEDLRAAIEQFGMVSIYELFDRIGKTADSDYTYQNYGWKDLTNAGVRYTRNGYLLELPRPVYLGEH